MINKKNPAQVRTSKIKKSLCVGLLMVFFVNLFLFVPKSSYAQGVETNATLDTIKLLWSAEKISLSEKLYTTGQLLWENLGTNLLIEVADTYLQNMAQKIAVGIATGAKGGGPLIVLDDWKKYSDNALDSAAGTFIEGLTKGTGFEDICTPDLGLKLKFSLALFKLEEPKKPKCTLSEITKNWNTALNDPNLLKNFSATFDTKQNDFGVFLDLNDKLAKQKQKEAEAEKNKRQVEETTGKKSITRPIDNSIVTPAAEVAQMSFTNQLITSLSPLFKQQTISNADGKNQYSLIPHFIKTLGNTLWNEMAKDLFKGKFTAQDGVDYWNQFCDQNPEICNPGDTGTGSLISNLTSLGGSTNKNNNTTTNSLKNPNAQETKLSKATAELKYKKFISVTGTEASNYDVLPSFTNCPKDRKPGPNNCIVNNSFTTAISTKMTLKEAIAQGKINGDQIFGFNKNGTLTNENGLPYRSILVLRKYRIVPVGWELAAEHIEKYATQNQTLNSLIKAYDDKNSDYYQFVDPNWVLKIPSMKCESLGFGPELLSETITPGIDINKNGDWNDPEDAFPAKSIVRNDQYCAKEQTCIKEKADGTCEFYGDCIEEKRTFKIAGDGCDSTFNTCQTFRAPNNTNVSYLKNTLNWSDCDANNAGCLDLCADFNPNENDVLTANMVGYWKLDSFTPGKPVQDFSGKQNNGTLKDTPSGAPDYTPTISIAEGRVGNSFSFQGDISVVGDKDYIEIPDNSSLNFGDGVKDSPFSISAWIKTDDNHKIQTIVSKYKNSDIQYMLQLISDGSYDASIRLVLVQASGIDLDVKTTKFVQANKWYHVVSTYDGSSKDSGINIYVNGIKQTDLDRITDGAYVAMKSSTNPVMIGMVQNTDFFKGKIDDVAIYNKELTEKEVYNKNMSYDCLRKDSKIYLSGQATTCDQTEVGCNGYLEADPNMVAYWQFEEGKGTKTYDSSGHRIEGIISESKWVQGQKETGLEFDGVNDRVTIPNNNKLNPNTGNFSLELWIKPFTNTNVDHQRFIWKDNGDSGINHRGYYLSNINGTFMGEFADNAGESTSFSFGKYTSTDWNHLVLVRDKKANKIITYLNGSLAEEVNDQTRDVDFNGDFIIGGRNDLSEMFNGVIDEVAVYNNMLSEQEIQNHFTNGINFNSKNIKVANTNLHCFGRTTGDAMFDLPADVNNCISLGERFDTNLAEGGCFEYLHHKTKDYCEKNSGTWLSSPIQVTKHTAQSYCETSGGVWSGTICTTQCLKIDEPECSSYAFNCKAVESGCERYTPTAGGTPIPGVATEDDKCPAECAGYDTYKQEATNFESSDFPVYFIPETAKDCSSAVAGCDEFTNIDSAKENLEYYSYMRQCEPIPTAAATYQCGTFYTWIDVGSKGFQLQANYLKSSGASAGENPIEILRIEEDLGPCEDANDALTNENCKEFYNGEGVITYHLLKKTVSCSNQCTNYRKTEPAKFDLVQTCKNIGGTWGAGVCDINNQVACKNINGAWKPSPAPNCYESLSSTTVIPNISEFDFCTNSNYLNANWDATNSICSKTNYKAIPAEGLVCAANEKGCREFTGNTGGNIMTVFNDNFEGNNYIYSYPDAGTGWTGGSISSVSTVQGQQSIKVSDGTTQLIEKWLYAKCTLDSTCLQSNGCECKEADLDSIGDDSDGTPDTVCRVGVDQSSCDIANYTYDKGTYLLSFWAKGNLDDDITVKIVDTTTNELVLGTVKLTEDWKYYILGPTTLDLTDWSEYYMLKITDVKSNGGSDDSKFSTYIDNVKLEAVTDSIFKIKNSWKTPASCDRDPLGNPYLYYMLGCDEYTDSQNNISYLKSFTNVCRDEAVGCKQYIDTQNSSAPYEQTWNENDPSSKITVPADALVYLAPKETDSCLVKGCSLLGQPNYNQDRTIVNNIRATYRVNNPDLYDTSLCLKKDVGCQSYLAGDAEYYFRDPGDAVCEYVIPTGKTEIGWYKKEADKIYDSNSEKCPLSSYQNLGIERPTAGWAGTCPTPQSSCTALVDPLSNFSTENVRNSSFLKNLDNNKIPDDWSRDVDIYASNGDIGPVSINSNPLKYASSINLNQNSTYVLMTEIQKQSSADTVVIITCKNFSQSNSACPSVDDTGLYTIDKISQTNTSCGNKIANEIIMTIPNAELDATPKKFSTGFAPGTCNRVGLEIKTNSSTETQTFLSVSIKEAGVYYYLNSSLADAKTECNGRVDFDNGCVLLNNRDNVQFNNNDYTSYLTYNADLSAPTPTNCNNPDGSSFGCNADTLIKVRPDRDCAKWLYCNSTETIDGKELCTDIGLCDTLNSNGICIHTPLEYSDSVSTITNMNFDQSTVDKLKNLSGYSNVGYEWSPSQKIEGSLSPAQMKVYGENPGLINGNFEQTTLEETVLSSGKCSWDITTDCTLANANTVCTNYSNGERCNLSKTYKTKPISWTENGGSKIELINNPVDAQKNNITILEGNNVLSIKAGQATAGWPVHIRSNTFSLSPGTTYIITGFINTKNLSGSDAGLAGMIGLVDGGTLAAGSYDLSPGKDWTRVQFTRTATNNSGYLIIGDSNSAGRFCSNCGGNIYFDDISIKPSLNTQTAPATTNLYSAPSCKLYPKSEALSCDFTDPENGFEYKGTQGYCLESDPQYPEYCLNWFPVDTISSDESVLETVKYDGPAPLYYCLEESRSMECVYNDSMDSFETKKPITYCNQIIQTVDESGENKYWADRVKQDSAYSISGALNYGFNTNGPFYGAMIDQKNDPTNTKYTGNYAPYSCKDSTTISTCTRQYPSTDKTPQMTLGTLSQPMPLISLNTDNSSTCTVSNSTCSIEDTDIYEIKLSTNGTPIYTAVDYPAGAYGTFPVGYRSCNIENACVGIITFNPTSYTGIKYDSTMSIPAGCEEVTITCEHFTKTESNPCIVASDPSPETKIQELFAKSYGKWTWNSLNEQYDSTPPPTPPNWTVPNLTTDIPAGIAIAPTITITTLPPTIFSGVQFTLAFNSSVDPNQLPLVSYIVDWGDGKIDGKPNVSIKDQPTTPHIFKRAYDLGELRSKSLSTIDCSATTSCDVDITITIKDNWDKTTTTTRTITVQ